MVSFSMKMLEARLPRLSRKFHVSLLEDRVRVFYSSDSSKLTAQQIVGENCCLRRMREHQFLKRMSSCGEEKGGMFVHMSSSEGLVNTVNE